MTFKEHLAAAEEAWEKEHPHQRILIVSVPVSKELLMDQSARGFLMDVIPQEMARSAKAALDNAWFGGWSGG